jgi:NAD(P)-dependent dehydrogenase (short-subunit alcohol dehydrogenase family)
MAPRERFGVERNLEVGLLTGQVAIVTGAGRGIGRAEALLLAREGASVLVNDLGVALDGRDADAGVASTLAEEIEAAGGHAIADAHSVASHEAAARIIDRALDAFGRLDILVNNAGFTRDKMVYNTDEETFDTVVEVHLKGTFNMAKWACRYFREAGHGGRIINTTSAAGLVGNVGQSNYGAAKAGIAAMTLIWSREMERFDVTANAIAPAARTRMTAAAFGDLEPDEDEAFDVMAPENVAPLVVYLASPPAADVTGQVFGISGGDIELFEPWRPVKSLSKEGRWTPAELVKRMPEII